MPWNLFAIPVIIALIWGIKNGLKTKIASNTRFKRPFKL
jgi:hypothetical protein